MLGNFRPDLVSFLPAMRYYAGNWATSQWLFRKDSGAEEKLDRAITKPAPIVVEQLTKLYDRETAEFLLNKGLAFRSMHSHGRALNGLLPRAAVDDVEAYHVREGELISGVVNGWNFGDGHLHDQQLLEAVQERCSFEPGELRVIVRSSPSPRTSSASATGSTTPPTGLIEEGWVERRRHGRARSPGSSESWEFPVEVTGRAPAPARPRERRDRRRLGPQRARLRRRAGRARRARDRARGRRRRSAAAPAPAS